MTDQDRIADGGEQTDWIAGQLAAERAAEADQ